MTSDRTALNDPARAAETAAELHDRMRQETIARLTHDLRTPLNSIIGFSDLLLSDIGGKLNDKQREFIDAIHRNGHVLLALINDMLDWSTIESGRTTLRAEAVELSSLFADAQAMTGPVVASAGLSITWPDPVVLKGTAIYLDRKRIIQLIINLVDNARKFTPAGGAIVVSVTIAPTAMTLVIEDNGPGISAHDIEKMFLPYGARSHLPQPHAAGARLTGAHGTGLGLSIVRGIVQLHHGTIAVDRGRMGGARFIITLPIAP